MELTLLEAESPPASTSPPLLLHTCLSPVAPQLLQPTLLRLLAAATAVLQRPNALLRKTQSIAIILTHERTGKINPPPLLTACCCCLMMRIHGQWNAAQGAAKNIRGSCYLLELNGGNAGTSTRNRKFGILREGGPLIFFRNSTAIGFKSMYL